MSQVMLIVRDPDLRGELEKSIHSTGLSVSAPADIDEALSHIDEDPPTLLLAESPVDDTSIIKLQESVRRKIPSTPMLVYLPSCDSRLALKNMAAGAYDCLHPPFNTNDFLMAARRAVRRVSAHFFGVEPSSPPAAWWRLPITYVCLGLVLFFGLFGIGFFDLFSPPFQIYELTASHPVSVSGNKDDVWIVDQKSRSLARMRVEGDYLMIVKVYQVPDFQPVSVVQGKTYLYTASSDGYLRQHNNDKKLSVTASVRAPGPSPSGLSWDGDNLWSCDAGTGKIYQHAKDMTVIDSFSSPAAIPAGLAWKGKALWVADSRNQLLWKLWRQKGKWKKEGPFMLDVFNHNPDLKLSGFTMWKNNAWIVSEGSRALIRHRVTKKK